MTSHLFTCCGSPAYAAPELVAGREYVGAEVSSYCTSLYILIVFVTVYWLLSSGSEGLLFKGLLVCSVVCYNVVLSVN